MTFYANMESPAQRKSSGATSLIVGLLLSLEIVRMQLMGGTSMIALALAAIFIILTIAYFVFKF